MPSWSSCQSALPTKSRSHTAMPSVSYTCELPLVGQKDIRHMSEDDGSTLDSHCGRDTPLRHYLDPKPRYYCIFHLFSLCPLFRVFRLWVLLQLVSRRGYDP